MTPRRRAPTARRLSAAQRRGLRRLVLLLATPQHAEALLRRAGHHAEADALLRLLVHDGY